MKDVPLVFKLGAEGVRIGDVSVMGKRHIPFEMIYDDGLGVLSTAAARSAVSDMTDRRLSHTERIEAFRREHVVHKPRILVGGKHAVAVYDDPARFLPTMLKGE